MTTPPLSPLQPGKPAFRRLSTVLSGFTRHLMPPPCLLCGCQTSSRGISKLCSYCTLSLPTLGIHYCRCCSLPLTSSSSLCGECLRKRPAFIGSAIPFIYGYPLDHLILEFKYRHHLASGRCLGDLLLDHLHKGIALENITKPDLLIPVPLHWWRQWRRGFNQAEWLARHVGRGLNIPVLNSCRRKHQSQNQKGLGRRERQRNLRNTFSLIPDMHYKIRGKYIAVVDDVVTTGATARVLSDILMCAGARGVDIWALARTPAESA